MLPMCFMGDRICLKVDFNMSLFNVVYLFLGGGGWNTEQKRNRHMFIDFDLMSFAAFQEDSLRTVGA